ncbi:MAG: hypothetical protein ACYS9X_12735 [Planctomycetota bacterium]|jgi:hypothetical protein
MAALTPAASELHRKNRRLAFRMCCHGLVLLILGIAIIVLVPESANEGVCGETVRSFFTSYWPFAGLFFFALSALGPVLGRVLTRRLLPSVLARAPDPDERLRLGYTAYWQYVRMGMTSGQMPGTFGLLCFCTMGVLWPLPVGVAFGLAMMLAFFPTEQRWGRFLRSVDDGEGQQSESAVQPRR